MEEETPSLKSAQVAEEKTKKNSDGMEETLDDGASGQIGAEDPEKGKGETLSGEERESVSRAKKSAYQVAFVDDLSGESGSPSQENAEMVGLRSLVSQPDTENSSQQSLQSHSKDSVSKTGVKSNTVENVAQNDSAISSSNLIPGSTFSSDVVGSLTKEREGEAEGKDSVDGGRVKKSSKANVMEEHPTSITPPPRSKLLSQESTDSDAIVTPPFSPLEYHSGDEDTNRGHTFPVLTPSPLPPGATSPLDDQPAMSILFGGVFYLGSSTVDAPISETEANRKMNILHEQALTSHPMPIILSVPVTNNGSVILKDPKTDQPLTTFPVKMILFCARGNESSFQDCFCLNVRHKRSGTYHCHVFQCEIMEAVSQ